MPIIKRSACIIISFLLILCSLVSCSGEEKPEETTVQTDSKESNSAEDTTVPVQEESTLPKVDDNLPESLKFDGETVSILAPKIKEGSVVDLYTNELNSDPINDSIYNRELYAEDRLGVKVEFPQFNGTYLEEIQKQANTGDDTYQLYYVVSHEMADYVFDGYYLDLSELDYLDFDMPWWNSDFIYECSVKNKVFMLTGSLSLTMLREIHAVYFNKTLANDYGAGIPDLNDMYGLVDSGKWTIDKLMELSGGIYRDMNGDQVRDIEDCYGVICVGSTADMPWGAFDISVFEKDEDDWFVFNVNTDKLFSAYEKIYDLFYNTDGSATAYFEVSGTDAANMFANGNALFLLDSLSDVENISFRNMKDDYGILPEPKYNEQQKEYYAYSGEFSCFAIPVTNARPEVTAAVLEAMSSYSYNETVPAYLDLALKGRYMSDAQSRKMIDLTIKNVKIDAAWTYLEEIGAGYAPSFRYRIWDKENSFASNHQSHAQKIKRAMIGYTDKYKKTFGD